MNFITAISAGKNVPLAREAQRHEEIAKVGEETFRKGLLVCRMTTASKISLNGMRNGEYYCTGEADVISWRILSPAVILHGKMSVLGLLLLVATGQLL